MAAKEFAADADDSELAVEHRHRHLRPNAVAVFAVVEGYEVREKRLAQRALLLADCRCPTAA